MTYIIHIETATKKCSVALSQNGALVSLKEGLGEGNSHAVILTSLIDEVMKEQNITYDNLSAVCVNKGPGSYTGLRIGVSAAKGLCFAKDIPLIAVDSLVSTTQHCLDNAIDFINEKAAGKDFYLCPMIDARRMEVYSAIYDKNLNLVEQISAVVIDENSFNNYISQKPFFLFGDGAEKCQETLKSPNLFFIPNIDGSAKGLVKMAYQKFLNKDFENLAYFEPFYLKDFVAGKPKVKGLYS
jgi:tRNA threonylcarbamoyladenosine biosynthesis protein TsaB